MILALIPLAIHYKCIEAGNFFFWLRQSVVLLVFSAVLIVYLLCHFKGKALAIAWDQGFVMNRHLFFLKKEDNPIDITGFNSVFVFLEFQTARQLVSVFRFQL